MRHIQVVRFHFNEGLASLKGRMIMLTRRQARRVASYQPQPSYANPSYYFFVVFVNLTKKVYLRYHF